MSCFYVSAWLRVFSSRALSRLHVEAWCSDPPALVSWVSVSCRGSDTRAPCSVSLCECAVLSSLGRALFCPHVFCGVARSLWISLAACFHVVMSCVNTWLMSILIRCLFVSCFAHGWWFVCWPCACVFVLCAHMALSSFSVCHVLSCQFVLTPPTLFPDYWLICPTCLCSLPSSFAPFILSLCLQSYASSSLNVSCSCPAKPCQLSWFSPMG